MIAGVYTATSQSVRKGSLQETIVKNKSLLLIDTPENYFDHVELKNETIFSVVDFVRIIVLVRNPADTLLENFVSRKLGPTLTYKKEQNIHVPSKGIYKWQLSFKCDYNKGRKIRLFCYECALHKKQFAINRQNKSPCDVYLQIICIWGICLMLQSGEDIFNMLHRSGYGITLLGWDLGKERYTYYTIMIWSGTWTVKWKNCFIFWNSRLMTSC